MSAMNGPTTHLRPAGTTQALCGALGFGWTYVIAQATCAACLDTPVPIGGVLA